MNDPGRVDDIIGLFIRLPDEGFALTGLLEYEDEEKMGYCPLSVGRELEIVRSPKALLLRMRV